MGTTITLSVRQRKTECHVVLKSVSSWTDTSDLELNNFTVACLMVIIRGRGGKGKILLTSLVAFREINFHGQHSGQGVWPMQDSVLRLR